MLICSFCGKEVSTDDKFCSCCGTELSVILPNSVNSCETTFFDYPQKQDKYDESSFNQKEATARINFNLDNCNTIKTPEFFYNFNKEQLINASNKLQKLATGNILERIINVQKNLNNKLFKIAIVANMSTGKSSLINAMFGDEILPTFNQATTDCQTLIYSDDDPSNNCAVIEFNNATKFKIDKNDVKSELKKYAVKETLRPYVGVSDNDKEKYSNVTSIELYWDFLFVKNLPDKKIKFCVIDTPGPNNTGDFSVKHRSITNRVVRDDADLAIFLFDYQQLDATLTADGLKLWDAIKERKSRDKMFDVFFVINKIDYALQDNAKSFYPTAGINKDSNFFSHVHENLAIEKLTKYAKYNGFSDPKIFTISSKFAILHRMNQQGFFSNLSYNTAARQYRKEIEDFKEFFKNPESAFLEYSGILKLEDAINHYIMNILQKKNLSTSASLLESIFLDIFQKIDRECSIFNGDIKETTSQLDKCNLFLSNEFPTYAQKITSDIENKFKAFFDKTENFFNAKSQDIIKNRLPTIAQKGINYADLICFDNQDPETAFSIIDSNSFNRSLYNITDYKYEIETKKTSLKSHVIMAAIQDYSAKKIEICFQDFANEYAIERNLLFSDLLNECNNLLSIIYENSKTHLHKILNSHQLSAQLSGSTATHFTFEYFSLPDTSVDTNFEQRTSTIQDGTKKEFQTKTIKIKRSIFNPRRWFGDQYYYEEIESKEIVPNFINKTEDYVKITLYPKAILDFLCNRSNDFFEGWLSMEKQNLQTSIDNLRDDINKIKDRLQKDFFIEIEYLQKLAAEKQTNVSNLTSKIQYLQSILDKNCCEQS